MKLSEFTPVLCWYKLSYAKPLAYYKRCCDPVTAPQREPDSAASSAGYIFSLEAVMDLRE